MANGGERIVNGVKTRLLHGKDYVEVAERIRVVHELKKKVEMVESAALQVADHWLWRVVLKVDDLIYIGNAEVKLNAPKNTPDGTNPFECAETSALGRALAFAGLGTIESIASYDEIARAQPFTAIVEAATQRGNVIDAGAGTPQIAQRRTVVDAHPASTSNHQDQETAVTPSAVDKVRGRYTKVYRVAEQDLEQKWGEFKLEQLGKKIDDVDLSATELAKLNGQVVATYREQQQQSKAS